jgi:hypothetical protein
MCSLVDDPVGNEIIVTFIKSQFLFIVIMLIGALEYTLHSFIYVYISSSQFQYLQMPLDSLCF